MSDPAHPKTAPTDPHTKWGVFKPLWPRAKAIGKGITGLAELGAAAVVILAWFPQAVDTICPNLKEYKTLDTLYAGASVAQFDAKLGPPSIIKAVPAKSGITERLYVKKDYVVETLATEEGQTTMYSVLSCDSNFKPTFKSFGSEITLQDKPLAATSPPGQQPIELHYEKPTLVGSATYYFELYTDTSGASHGRGSGSGVNGVCGKLPDADDYSGPASLAPEKINDYRMSTPANFYVESTEQSIRNGADNLVTPFHEDLPPNWHKP
jgi:hypothetical protein